MGHVLWPQVCYSSHVLRVIWKCVAADKWIVDDGVLQVTGVVCVTCWDHKCVTPHVELCSYRSQVCSGLQTYEEKKFTAEFTARVLAVINILLCSKILIMIIENFPSPVRWAANSLLDTNSFNTNTNVVFDNRNL